MFDLPRDDVGHDLEIAVRVHAETAAGLGRLLAARGITLVYGGGAVGLMGIAARAAKEAGGKAIGVLPRCLARDEIPQEIGDYALLRAYGMSRGRALFWLAMVQLTAGIGAVGAFYASEISASMNGIS